jgi:hypothetical protein
VSHCSERRCLMHLFHILSPNLEDISSIKIMSAFADYSRRTMSVSLAAACQMSMLS